MVERATCQSRIQYVSVQEKIDLGTEASVRISKAQQAKRPVCGLRLPGMLVQEITQDSAGMVVLCRYQPGSGATHSSMNHSAKEDIASVVTTQEIGSMPPETVDGGFWS